MQYRCYCTGYAAGVVNGVWVPGAENAVVALKADMGIRTGTSADYQLQPKAFKGLLTMNSYVVLAGGSERVRSVQQWLNGRYWHRRDFFVVPCDGLYSRNVQKAMLMAIQFELGMSDDQATGTFGPATQSGLRSQGVVSEGTSDSGRAFVRLFQAAMLVNGYDVAFDGAFGAGTADQVRRFQAFAALPETWAAT